MATKSGSDSNQNSYSQLPDSNLEVRCRKYWGENPLDPEGDTVELLDVAIMGVVNVPYANFPITQHIFLQDITNGINHAKLLACSVNELGDSEGMFRFSEDFSIPYETSTWDDFQHIATIPLFLLIAPYKGHRQISVLVQITGRGSTRNCYSQGHNTFLFQQTSYGYLEVENEFIKLLPRMAELAICIAAADGHIDAVEKEQIKTFAKELSLDDGEIKVSINNAMRRTLEAINTRRKTPSDIIDEICDELIMFDAEELNQRAYRSCVDMVIADDKVEKSEEQALKHIASRLHLSDEFVREIHDEKIRLSMHTNKPAENTLGIPNGLSHEEKKAWVNREYKKWRARATSKNAEYAMEASERLKLLAEMRTKLNRGNS